MTAIIQISVLPGRVYKVSVPAGVKAYYSGVQVGGAGSSNLFVGIEGVTTMTLVSDTQISGSISITEIQRSYYTVRDGLGGTWSYQPDIDKWVSVYSFSPEWMSNVGNRLVTFKNGKPYVHDNATRNTFYGQSYDSAVAFVHNEAGNAIKAYMSVSIEGDTPDLVHCRTERPNIQSSDIRGSEYEIKEGVKYAPILRDRLSPNASGTFDQKMYNGDRMRGEIGKFQLVHFTPTAPRDVKLVNVGFIPSRGHNTIPENDG